MYVCMYVCDPILTNSTFRCCYMIYRRFRTYVTSMKTLLLTNQLTNYAARTLKSECWLYIVLSMET